MTLPLSGNLQGATSFISIFNKVSAIFVSKMFWRNTWPGILKTSTHEASNCANYHSTW